MKSTNWTRRQVLKGAGVALSVPWLETFAAREARAAAPVRRYMALYFPNGTADYWGATGAGASMTLNPIMQPLEPNKTKALVLGNVGNYSPWGMHVEPSHGNNMATAWTGVQASGDMNANSSISIDQAIANQIQAQNGGTLPTPLHSLQIGLSTMNSSPDGLPGPHSRSVSWKSAGEPLYKVISPQDVFDRLVAGGLPMKGNMTPMTDPAAARRVALKKSALDYITESSTSLKARLSKSDAVRMEQFLTTVRTLESRITAMPLPTTTGSACSPVARPTAVYSLDKMLPLDYNRGTHATLMIDLAVMAYQCDLTRVISFMLDDARSDFVYNFLNARLFTATGSTPGTIAVGGYHAAQHAGTVGTMSVNKDNGFSTIGWWNVARANELVTKISAIQEGAGTAMDNTVIHFMSGMHGGNHDSLDLPLVLLGTGGGVLKTGQAIKFTGQKNLQDVHLTILNKVFGGTKPQFGVAVGSYAGTTGIINELLA